MVAVGVDQALVAALDPLVAAGRDLSTVGLGPLIATIPMSRWDHMGPRDRLHFHPIDIALGGVNLAQLAIGVLGVLVITGEYSTGMIRSTIIAVPKRLPVLWAKVGVFAVVTFVLMLPSVADRVLRQPGDPRPSITSSDLVLGPGVARAVVGGALYLTVLGVFALALGAIVAQHRRRDRDLRRDLLRDPAAPRTCLPTELEQRDLARTCRAAGTRHLSLTPGSATSRPGADSRSSSATPRSRSRSRRSCSSAATPERASYLARPSPSVRRAPWRAPSRDTPRPGLASSRSWPTCSRSSS